MSEIEGRENQISVCERERKKKREKREVKEKDRAGGLECNEREWKKQKTVWGREVIIKERQEMFGIMKRGRQQRSERVNGEGKKLERQRERERERRKVIERVTEIKIQHKKEQTRSGTFEEKKEKKRRFFLF